MIQNSEGLGDKNLESLIQQLQHTQDVNARDSKLRNKKQSYNLTMSEMRTQRSLENYTKYQHIWMKNIEKYDHHRQKHNSPVYSKNSKFNQIQHENGDITI